MIDGLMKDKSRYEDGKAILEALNALKREEDPNYKMDEMQLRAFMEDPYDKKAREREAALRHEQFNPFVRKFEDTYIDAIRIIEPPSKIEATRYGFGEWKNTGIDQELNRTFYDEKQDFLTKLKDQQDKETKTKKDRDVTDYSKVPRRPTLMGVADKIVNNLQSERPYRPPQARKNDPNPKIDVPQVYFSNDRQSRLGEQSDLLGRFQSVVMHKPHIKNTLF